MNTESVEFRTLGEDHRQLRPSRAAKPLCSPPPPAPPPHHPYPSPTPPHPSHTHPSSPLRLCQIPGFCNVLNRYSDTDVFGSSVRSADVLLWQVQNFTGRQKSVAPPGRSKFRKYHTYEGAGVGDCLRCELVAFSQCRHYECSTFYSSCHGTVLTTQLAFHALHTQCCLGLHARSLPMFVAFD